MIRDFEFYHGLVIARILHTTRVPVSIRVFQAESNASYVINDSIGIYIKHSAKRMTPWSFSFKKEHQEEIDKLRSKFERVFIALVCGDDGVVCLSYVEVKQLFADQPGLAWISATRHKRQMYAVKGSSGELDFKIGQNDFPGRLFMQEE